MQVVTFVTSGKTDFRISEYYFFQVKDSKKKKFFHTTEIFCWVLLSKIKMNLIAV